MEAQLVSSDIRMFILMTGESIIGRVPVIQSEGHLHIESPAEIITKRNTHGPLGFALYPWLPNELLDRTDISIPEYFVIGEVTPSNALKKFYDNWSLEELTNLNKFKELFEQQIGKLGDSYAKRSKISRDQQQKTQTPIDTTLSDVLIELFDEQDSGWGDPSITH